MASRLASPLARLGARPAAPYTAPFLTLLAVMGFTSYLLPLPAAVAYPLRTLAVFAVWLLVSRKLLGFRPSRPRTGILLGAAVFALWIAPDLVWPGYRDHWLFHNSVTGAASSSASPAAQSDPVFLFFRIAGSVLLVPVVEELFWRGWAIRWLMARDFSSVPLGAYSARAFLISALLFAAEHGPYWDVGLAAGLAYNWWIVRTRNLADCILAHAVTNACLAAYVLAAGQWQYWM
ncbi:MAG: CAAX prenyl protease-related protein [Acidobacteriota bacterium]